MSSRRALLIKWLVGFIASVGLVQSAYASAGCTAVNGGGFNFAAKGKSDFRTVSGFAIGDKVSFVMTREPFGGDGVGLKLSDVASTIYTSPDYNVASETTSYTFATGSATTLTTTLDSNDTLGTLTATCVPAPTGPTGPTESQKLRSLQIQGTKIVAQTSGGAIGGAVDGGIFSGLDETGGALSDNTGGNSAPAGLGGPVPDKLGSKPQDDGGPQAGAFVVKRSGWSAWGDLRLTGSRRAGDTGFQGHQFNGTAGIGRLIAPGLVVGVFIGAERFSYDVPSLNGKLSGGGVTGGAYLGGHPLPGVRFDLAGAFTDLDYDATSGTATGHFSGQRTLLSTGVTGTTNAGGFVLEPSARLFAIWEHQGAYTDSLGTEQAENDFALGRSSLGLRVARPWQTRDGPTWTPYAGLYADHYFSRGHVVTTGTEILAIADGWSARAIGGVTLDLNGGASVSVGGEAGGIGASHTQRTLNVRGTVPF